MSINKLLRGVAWLSVLFFGSTVVHGAAVNFSLTLDTASDPGATYENFNKSGDGLGNAFTIGFQIQLNSVDGVALSNSSPIAAFCAELAEPIAATTYTFQAAPLANLSAGRAGEAGTASSGIPVGGIGQQRAAYVRYLFDQYYISDRLSEWTITQAEPTSHAFQLALWEITHDSDLSLSSGDVYIGAQTSGTAIELELRNNAINLANEMLLAVSSAGIDSSYTSTNFNFWALVNDDGEGLTGNQDVILATKKSSLLSDDLTNLIPEPTTYALICLFAGFMLTIKRVFVR